MRNATSYANDLYQKSGSFPGLVQTVATIQKDAFQEGQKQALGSLQEISQEVDARLARLKATAPLHRRA